MIINGLALCLVVAVVLTAAYLIDKHRSKRPDDAQLSEWEEFLIKGNRETPKKKPIVTTSELPALAYDAIEKLWNPKLKREFNERYLSLKNEICARAIQLEKVARRMNEGKPLSSFDDSVLIREKLRNGDSKDAVDDEPLEFTPGRRFNEPTTEDGIQNEN